MANDKNTKKESPVVNIDGEEYKIENMSNDQKIMLSHIQDLTRKIETTQFNLQQMQVGKDSFVKLLKDELTKDEDKDK
tara:strand:+ start:1091 stop:1324 length:234 start_codon:yes stop_codon:yes gene_type:complete